MNPKLIMTVSSIFMWITGIILSFFPQEITHYSSVLNEAPLIIIMLQILGALYFAFAMVNWTAKANLIGGIYGRPIAIGNLTHFVIGALLLIKAILINYTIILAIACLVYTAFAILFSVLFFTHPLKKETL